MQNINPFQSNKISIYTEELLVNIKNNQNCREIISKRKEFWICNNNKLSTNKNKI